MGPSKYGECRLKEGFDHEFDHYPSGARSWVMACALASALTPLDGASVLGLATLRGHNQYKNDDLWIGIGEYSGVEWSY
jgi:hypothetical protein